MKKYALIIYKGFVAIIVVLAIVFASLFALVLISVLLFGAYGIGYDASDFIYGQF